MNSTVVYPTVMYCLVFSKSNLLKCPVQKIVLATLKTHAMADQQAFAALYSIVLHCIVQYCSVQW